MMASTMFFDDWYSHLSSEDQDRHADDCPRCGYKLAKVNEIQDKNGVNSVMECESCGYTEIWYDPKNISEEKM